MTRATSFTGVRRRALARLGCALCFAAPSQAAAQAAPEPAPAAAPAERDVALASPKESAGSVIVVLPKGSPSSVVSRLAEALRSQLAEVGVEVQLRTGTPDEVTPQSDERAVVAVIWIEQSQDALVVHFYEPAGASLRERYIPVRGGDAASIEEIAVVVRSAVGALVERSRAVPAQAAPEPAPKPRPSPPSPTVQRTKLAPRLDARLSVAYLFTRFAADAPYSHGPSLAVAWHPRSRPFTIGVGYAWLSELEHSTSDVAVSIRRHPIEAFAGAVLELGAESLRLEPELALVVDPVVRTTTRAAESIDVTPATTRWSWAVGGRLRLAWGPLPRVWLFGSAGADALLNRFDVVVRADTERTLLSQLGVRPRLQLGATIDL